MKDPLKQYYLVSMGPLFLFGISLLIIGVSTVNVCVFMTSVLFPVTLATPGLKEKISDRKYRFSVLRVFFKIQNIIDKKLKSDSPWWLKSFHRLFLSFLFTTCLVIISPAVNPLYFFLGWLWWEGFYRLNEKRQWTTIKAVVGDPKIHQVFESEESDYEPLQDHQNHQKDND